MELEWITLEDGQLHQPMPKQPPARQELLPAWKQVIMESRQEQTASLLLIAMSKQRRTALEQQVEVARKQRFAFLDRWPNFLSKD